MKTSLFSRICNKPLPWYLYLASFLAFCVAEVFVKNALSISITASLGVLPVIILYLVCLFVIKALYYTFTRPTSPCSLPVSSDTDPLSSNSSPKVIKKANSHQISSGILIALCIVGTCLGTFLGFYFGANSGYDVGYDNGLNYGYSTGYQDGNASGYEEGSADGYIDGYDTGYEEGSADGYIDGYDTGYNEGYSSGYSDGHNSAEAQSLAKREAEKEAQRQAALQNLIDKYGNNDAAEELQRRVSGSYQATTNLNQ